ncbi:kinase-like protein [Massarina eburnea CBS 473.64]|uniref:non-specific serine/threonine protein kinase n=1 Tax=Massarina eburnea CBS 473.64 TaxID=1395130 RepID=A0A6A6SG81_9PLEO|nr:kinase-like protein [Massarina eburnea CBS 473.64]
MPPTRRDFVQIKQLAAGDQGAFNQGIFLVRNCCDNSECIEKRIAPGQVHSGHARREIAAMVRCKHPNIVQWIAHDIDYRSVGYASIFMEHCELESLSIIIDRFISRFAGLGHFPEKLLWKILWDMSLALCYLQLGVDATKSAKSGKPLSRNDRKRGWDKIFHRDIKPGNIFAKGDIAWPTITLGDFGCSITSDHEHFDKRAEEQLMTAFTPVFGPPEQPNYTRTSDVYSLGLVVHCAARARPYPMSNTTARQRDPVGSSYSKELSGLVSRMLSLDPDNRPEAARLPYIVHREHSVVKDREQAKHKDQGRKDAGRRREQRSPQWVTVRPAPL